MGFVVILSYWPWLLGRWFSVVGGTVPFFTDPCFHDNDIDKGAGWCN